MSTPAADGYNNDHMCAHCGQPLIGMAGGWCADCCGLPPAERVVYQASAELVQRMALRSARVQLAAYSQLLVAALRRVDTYSRAIRAGGVMPGADYKSEGLDDARDLAALFALQDALIVAHAALLLRPDLRPMERAA